MILFALIAALCVIDIPAGGMTLTVGAVFSIASALYYLRQDLAMGIAMAVVLFGCCAAASELEGRLGAGGVLAAAGVIFVVGWIIQFVGHKFEGMKPAFFDDAMQLMVGPLFICAEVFFALGAKAAVREYIEARVGPTVARREKPASAPDLTGEAH